MSSFPASENIQISPINTEGFYDFVFPIDTFLLCSTLRDTLGLDIYSARTFKKLNSLVKVGDGKGQMLHIYSITKIQDHPAICWLYDVNLKKILKINVRKAAKNEPYQMEETILTGEKRNLSSPTKINDTTFVASSYLLPDCRYFYFNTQKDQIKKLGQLPPAKKDWPLPSEGQKGQFNFLARTYNGLLTVSPDTKTLAFAYKTTDRIDFYKNDSLVKVIRGPGFFDPVKNFVKMNNVIVSQEYDKTKYAYVDMSSDKQHIYVLYSGNSQKGPPGHHGAAGDRILIFDWAGNPVKIWHLSKSLARFSLTHNSDGIELFGIDNETFGLTTAKLDHIKI